MPAFHNIYSGENANNITEFKGKAYNLQGQLVGNNGTEGLAKGLYIINGRKYVVE